MECVRCELQYSRTGAAFIAAAAVLALAIAATLPASVARALDAYARSRAIVGLELARDGRVELTRRDGSRVRGNLAAGGMAAPWMATLRWRPAGARVDRTLWLLPDMLPAEEFRQLRILLRWA
jgi:toxin CptA